MYFNAKIFRAVYEAIKSLCRKGAEFAFSIYDTDGTNVIDAVDLGNVLRALNLNPTNATIEKMGGTKKKNEKKMKLDEFLPIFSQCKKDKEQGCYEDFLECLKLYDKQENGMMLGAELSHTLLSLGMIYLRIVIEDENRSYGIIGSVFQISDYTPIIKIFTTIPFRRT